MINYMDKTRPITAEDLIRRYGLDNLKKDRKAINTLNDGLTKINKNLENYIEAVLSNIDNLQSQVDGNITTWFFVGVPTLENQPAKEWVKEEDKTNHLGDLYYDQDTGYAYRWANTDNEYKWLKITDNDVVEALAIANSAKDTADSKRRTFYNEPNTPYDSGDIWIYEGEIYRCIRSRENGNWNTEDWVNDLKYTDDTIANKAIEDLNKFIEEVTTYYVTTKVMEETIDSISSTIKSVQLDVDKKNKVFTDTPTPPYNVGDIWIQDEKIYVCVTKKEEGDFSKNDFRLDLDSKQFATKTQIEQTDEKVNILSESQKQIEKDITTSKQASGNPIEVNDAGEYNLESIGIDGKSYQETTTGKNKLPIIEAAYTQSGVTIKKTKQEIILNGTATTQIDVYLFGSWGNSTSKLVLNGNYVLKLAGNTNENVRLFIIDTSTPIDSATTNEHLKSYNNQNITSSFIRLSQGTTFNNVTLIPILYEGTSITEVEKYTGGTPSPNPEYPQEIKTVKGITNEFDKSKCVRKKYVNGIVGQLATTIDSETRILNKGMVATQNAKVSFSLGTTKALRYWLVEVDNTNTIVKVNTITTNKDTSIVTTSTTTRVEVLICWQSVDNVITLDDIADCNIMLVEGNLPNRSVPYGRWLEQITCGRQLFNKLKTTDGFYKDEQGNNLSQSTTCYSDYIKLFKGEEYHFKGRGTWQSVAIYDLTHKFKKLIAIADKYVATEDEYVVVNLLIANKDTCMIYHGQYNGEYEEYKENTALIDMNKDNLFNKNNADIVDKLFISTTGQFNYADNNKSLVIPIESNTTYTVEKMKSNRFRLGTTQEYDVPATRQANSYKVDDNGTKITITSTSTDHYLFVNYLTTDTNEQEILDSIKIYEGYEPYYELAEARDAKDNFIDGSLEKRMYKLILTGNESFDTWGKFGGFLVNLGLKAKYIASNMVIPNAICTHFIADGRFNVYNDTSDNIFSINDTTIYIRYNKYTKSADFRAFLKEQYDAGTPVIIDYELETPKTYQLSYEPLKLHKGYNYITLNDDLYPNMEIKYLTDSKFNAEYMTHAQFSIESDKIESSLRGKVSSDELNETITEVSNDFTQKIGESEASTESKITVATNNAINTSENYTNAQLANRPTKTEMTSAITQSANATEAKAEILVQQKIEDIQIGGTNLGRKGCISPYNSNGNTTVNNTNFEKNGSAVITRKAFMNEGPMLDRYVRYEVGQKYVISFEFKTSTSTVTSFNIHNGTNATNTEVYVDGILKGSFGQQIPFTPDGNYHKIELRFKAGNNQNPEVLDTNHIIFQPDKLNSRAYTGELRYFKIEKGDKRTDWSPAPEDKLDNSKFTKAEIVAEINNGVSNVKIYADNINLNGAVTANNNFKILTDGSMAAKNGKFEGEISGSTIKGGVFKGTTQGVKLQIGTDPNGGKYSNNSLQLIKESDNSVVLSIFNQDFASVSNPLFFRTTSNHFTFFDGTVDVSELNAFEIFANEGIYSNSQPVITSHGIGNNSIKSIRMEYSPKTYLEIVAEGGAYGIDAWASDKRLKRRVKDSKYDALDTLRKIKHRQFIYRNTNEKVLIGYVADELQKLDPNMVFEVGPQKIKQPNPSVIIPILSKAIQELQEIIDKQDKRITKLEDQVKKLLELVEREQNGSN